MSYTVRRPKVKDMRDIWQGSISEQDVPFELAMRCILKDGRQITEEELNELDIDEFEELMEKVNGNGKKKAADPV